MSNENLPLIVLVIFIVGVLFISATVDGLICRAKAVKQGLQYDYGMAQGCMVKYNGKWVDYDRLRYTEE